MQEKGTHSDLGEISNSSFNKEVWGVFLLFIIEGKDLVRHSFEKKNCILRDLLKFG